MLPFTKEFVSVHHHIISTGLKDLILMFLSIKMMVHFFLQCMNGIQRTNPYGIQWNRLFDAVVTIIKYKESTIDHDIYINVFTDGTVSYLTVSIDDCLNTTNNET